MADIFTVLIGSANFIHTIVTSPIFKDLGSTDIGDYETDTKMLALCIENITDKLYNVDQQKIKPAQKEACEKIREAVLDAEDILDKVETLTKKKKLKEVDDKVNRETKGKEIWSSVYASIKSFANKARAIFFCKINKSDEVQNAIKEINNKLDAIEKDLSKFGLQERSSRGLTHKMSARASDYHVIPQNIMGRDEDKTEIIELLSRCSTCKGGIPVVSVVGMGGMGKTTLAQLVYKSLQKDSHFDLLMWVSDSKKLDLRSLLKSILKCICPRDTTYDNHDANLLKHRLVEEISEKSFLLVLDDVENEDSISWEFLEGLLSEGNKERSRVLVTTRLRTVATAMGSSDSTYQLKGLSEEDSLQLFERYAFKGARDENLVEIGKLIVKKCGVPLALKVIGAFLDGKDKHEWEHVRKYGLAEDDQVTPILKMSYDDLDLTLKQCFSYCALFPKNYRLSKEELSSIWMANVRFKTNKGETLQRICEKNLKLLFNRCFLEVAEREIWERDDDANDDTHYKMHDLMHDLVKKVAGEEMVVADFVTRVDSNMLIIKENVRHLSIMSYPEKDTGTWTLKLKGRRLRTFMAYCDSFSEQPLNADRFVSDCPSLRFLDLRGCRIHNLTNSIRELIHLRYLNLSGGEFQTLDSITELINLQHLMLRSCKEMTHLPSEMGALRSLEVLHISSCDKLMELPKDVQRLTNLKRLMLNHCNALTHLAFEMGGLTSLEVLDVSYCGKFKELPEDIQRLTNLKRLLLKICKELTHLPSEMGGLASLEALDISGCDKLKELPMEIVKLTNLKDLNFQGCRGLRQMPPGMGVLVSVCRPQRLIVGHPESKHTAQLEELASVSELIQGRLEILLPYNITSKTPARDGDEYLLNKKSLRKLKIKWKKENNTEEEEEVPTNHKDILAILQPPTNLDDFFLKGYQGVTFPAWVPKDGFGSILPNLVEICIESCDRCRHLPALSRLPCLKSMKLMKLSSLEYIEEDVSGAPFFPSLETLFIKDLPELKGWCRGEEQLLMLPSFPRLLNLEIYVCPNLNAEHILVSFVKVCSVKSGPAEKELSEKIKETMSDGGEDHQHPSTSSSGTPPELFSSSFGLRIEICRKPPTSDNLCSSLSLAVWTHGHSLSLDILNLNTNSEYKSIKMHEAYIEMCKYLTYLHIDWGSGTTLKTLKELQHLTALQQLSVWKSR